MKGQFEFSWVIVVIILVVILILFITRELWCWYYKINKQCSLLEEQNALLNKLLNEQAQSRLDVIIRQMRSSEGVDEKMKVQDQMLWAGRMNSIRQRAEEIILAELIYT